VLIIGGLLKMMAGAVRTLPQPSSPLTHARAHVRAQVFGTVSDFWALVLAATIGVVTPTGALRFAAASAASGSRQQRAARTQAARSGPFCPLSRRR
jgi:hypothetical protein